MIAGLRVLVVDDEVPLTGVVSSYLVREGFDVSVAHSGPDAVESARELAPVLILLDIMLPGFDGIEACRRIRQFSDAYIIMLTARDEEVDKVLGLSMGADDYLVKPFSPRELIARVRAMLRRPRSAPVALIPKWHIVRGDTVAILSGRDAGKTGRVAEVLRHLNRVVVEGRNLVRRHVRASGGTAGGVVPTPSPIHYSNVNLLDPTLK